MTTGSNQLLAIELYSDFDAIFFFNAPSYKILTV